MSIPRLKQRPDPQAREAPRAPKPDTNILILPVEKDKKEINRRKNWPNQLSKDNRLKQFFYMKDEKNHYDCFDKLAVFDIDDMSKKPYTFSHRRKVLQTLNGKLIDPTKIKNEIDLLRYTTWAGIGHTENVNGPYHKIILKLSEHFDSAYFGSITLKNYTFTYPIRHVGNGLLHKDSCQRVNVTHGQFLTLSYMPFDFEMQDKIKRAISEGWETVFGQGNTENKLKKEGWITDITAYDPTSPKWYDYWYKGKQLSVRKMGMTDRLVGNERIIPIYHVVCDKQNVFHPTEKRLFFKDMLYEFMGLDKGKSITAPKTLTFNNQNAIEQKLDTVMKDYYNFDRWMYRMNPNLKHLKVMGTPKDLITVPFGGDMVVQLLMHETS